MTAEKDAPSRESAADGFALRVRAALAWRYGSQIAAQVIAWSSTLLVVRLLDPSDYGLFAMSQVVVAGLNFMNGWGFANSLVQARTIDRRMIGQVFAMLLLTNGVLAVAQLAIAPLAATHFREPMVVDILRVQALLYLTTPFIALPSALLSRDIQFRSQALANMIAAIVGALTALVMAYLGYGVWALVYAPIAAFAVRGVILSVSSRLLVMPVFDFRGAGQIIGFGSAMTAIQLLWILQSQSDIFIAGRAFETYELGLYAEAVFLTMILTSRFLPPLNDVAYPAYSELHKRGDSLAPHFVRVMRTVSLVVMPFYIGLALTAPEAVETVFGEKWLPMAPIVSGLALAMPAIALQIMCSPATNATGRARISLYMSLFGALAFPASFLVGIGYGPMGLVHAWWIAAPALLIFSLAITLPVLEVSLSQLLRAIAPSLVATAMMAGAVAALDPQLVAWHSALRLVALIATGVAIYGGVLWIGYREVVLDAVSMIRRRPASVPEPGDRTQTISG